MANKEDTWAVKIYDDLQEKDLQLVADFFNQNFPGVFHPSCSPNIWKWKLGSSNPAGRGFLTVAFLNGMVIGTTSGTRQRIRLGGELVEAMEIGDTFTHPDYRRKGRCKSNYPGTLSEDDYLNKSIFGRLVTETLDRASKAGVEYVFGTPHLNSRPPYLAKLGFTEVGLGKVRSWNYITPQYAAGMKNSIPMLFATKSLHYFTKMSSFRLRSKLTATEMPFENLAVSIERHFSTGISYSEGEGLFSFDLSLHFYEHRYFRHPSHKYRYFEIRRMGTPIGWIVCAQIKRQSGKETLVISDWLTLDQSFTLNLPACISMIVPSFPEVEIVSVWLANCVVKKFRWIFLGFFSLKEVSIIERSLNPENRRTVLEFEDFRIGWSDNG